MWTLIRIAIRNVARNRRRTLITLGALFVGVGVMVSMRGLLNGLQRALVTNVAEGQTGAVQVHRAGYMANVLSTPLTLDFAVADVLPRVLAEPGVTAAAPRINFAGMVSAGDETLFMAALAIDPALERRVTPLREKTLEPGGRFFDAGNRDGIVLTTDLARSVGIGLGGEASLLSPDRDGALSGEPAHVAGLMNLGLPGEKKIAMVPLALAQKLLKMDGGAGSSAAGARATELAVAVSPIERADAIAASLRAHLGPKYEVHTWSDVAIFVKQAMQRQNFVISLIAYAFMLLMLLGVANTMLMSVIERTREIGTMMAVGVRRSKILALFVVEALAIGAAGGTAGGLAGLGVVTLLGRRGISFSFPGSRVPFTLTPFMTTTYLVQIILMATAGAGLFALYPAFRASRLRPVQALAGQ
jgi:putative ABC transport system permease protein